ncbi:erythrocyte membrane protein 1, PfEMP1, putative [Plasmodium reichenowi]|uniref:Erythrocyte membrane protein 1, PfEMP1, putative n=1 Tax=Plasmodium reichenowi TaxID=5854 RepID=A0A2P9DTQ1_PLARE|nr:erythrocyte membrane protein 1, PfEMP1, putative [Plasmodium reichenowi]
MLRVLQIPKSDYDIPTLKSKNRYVPYRSAQYRGKRYIYLEGDSGTDSGYTDHYSDITSSSESEYEEFDINDIYVPGSPKYKTLIEVVLEPSKRDTQNGDIPSDDIQNDDIPSDNTPNNKLTDIEWNELKDEFISQYLPNIQPNDIPNNNISATIPTNTNNTTTPRDNVDNNTHPTPSRDIVDNNTHPTPSRHNVDNNTHPTPSRHTLDQKPFIMSIHDRNLLSGEEYSYDMINSGIYPRSSNRDSLSGTKDPISDNRDSYGDKNDPTSRNRDSYSGDNGSYSGIDLINDALSDDHDIYDELLKRKENELFGTEHHPKHTTTNRFAKLTNSDPIHNQLELFHKWLDRHRHMCQQWNNKEELLAKLKEKWNNETHSGNKTSGNITPTSDNTPPTSDIPSGKLSDIPSHNNIHSDIHPSDIPSGKLSDIPSDNNIHSGKLSDIPSGKLSDTPIDNNIHSDIQTSDIPSNIPNSDIHPSDIHSGSKTLNTDVSIEIDMDNPKHINEFTYVDSNPNQVENQNPNLVGNQNPNLVENISPNLVENMNPNLVGNMNPNLVGNQNPNITLPSNPNLVGNINPVDENPTNPNPNHVQIQMSVKNSTMAKEKYPIGDVWDI